MEAISCRLLYGSASPHLQQLYTGFHLLQRSGFVRLAQQIRRSPVYFKRSYLAAAAGSLAAHERGKVLPLGLNYRVLPDAPDFLAMRRGLTMTGLSRASLWALKQALDTRTLHQAAQGSPRTAFTGGFGRSPFTVEHYGNLVVAPESTSQESYLRTLRSFPICVASTGLHGSTGWKLAEYVAFAKAVLSEPLVYDPPGDFASGRNYIEFTSPAECVAGAVRLIEDSSLRRQIMRNNAAYYRDSVRPDALVKNALNRVLGLKVEQG